MGIGRLASGSILSVREKHWKFDRTQECARARRCIVTTGKEWVSESVPCSSLIARVRFDAFNERLHALAGVFAEVLEACRRGSIAMAIIEKCSIVLT